MLYQEFSLADRDRLNAGLVARFMALAGTDRIRQSHHTGGRFENTYIDASDIPEILPLLEIVKQRAGQYLGVGPDTLKAGFWFNAMEDGQRTAPHHHEENDELLSAVYYIRVPEDSGDLILHAGGREISIQPQAGKLVMFAPSVLHEVTVNQSGEMRLSVAFNVGPVDD
ncbi:MAG: putative 2OG-Fe(II) oxygenase [Gammaproteobacteria bacterium]